MHNQQPSSFAGASEFSCCRISDYSFRLKGTSYVKKKSCDVRAQKGRTFLFVMASIYAEKTSGNMNQGTFFFKIVLSHFHEEVNKIL